MGGASCCSALALVLALALPMPLNGNSAETAASHVKTGDALYARGDLAQAEDFYEAARGIYKSTHGADHPVMGAVCTKLGALYDAMGNHDKALEAHEQGLGIVKKTDGEMSEAAAGQIFNIGNVYWGQNKLQMALDRYKQAHSIYEALLGKDSERVGAAQSNMGSIYYLMGKYDKALEAQEEALRIDRTFAKSKAGEQQAGMSLFNIGQTLHKLNQAGQAEHRYKEAIFYFRRVFGNEHPTIAQVLTALASVLADTGMFDQATDAQTQALGMLIKTVGENHPQTAHAIYSFGTLYSKMGNHQEALESFVDAAGIYTKLAGADAEALGQPYLSAARAKKALGEANGARKAAAEALRIFELHGKDGDAKEVKRFLQQLDMPPTASDLPTPPS